MVTRGHDGVMTLAAVLGLIGIVTGVAGLAAGVACFWLFIPSELWWVKVPAIMAWLWYGYRATTLAYQVVVFVPLMWTVTRFVERT